MVGAAVGGLTPLRVKAWLGHLVLGEIERFHLPGIAAINVVLHAALDGGGMSSGRLDPLAREARADG